MAQLSLKGDAKTDQVKYRTGWGKHTSDKVQERNTEYTPSRSKPVLLVGQCKVDLWDLWVDGRQSLSA